MLEKMIMLQSIEDVRTFVSIACEKDYDIELLSGKYIVNGKSIMGVFSLDLTQPIKMVAHCEHIAELSRQTERFAVGTKK